MSEESDLIKYVCRRGDPRYVFYFTSLTVGSTQKEKGDRFIYYFFLWTLISTTRNLIEPAANVIKYICLFSVVFFTVQAFVIECYFHSELNKPL